jgi:arylsulfatase A-like enzyme
MHHGQVARMRMIRTPEWKLVRHFEPGGADELYHLADDPGELHNLAASPEPEHRRPREALARRLEDWMSRINDRPGSRPAPATVAPLTETSSGTAGRPNP